MLAIIYRYIATPKHKKQLQPQHKKSSYNYYSPKKLVVIMLVSK